MNTQPNPFTELFLYNQCFRASFSQIEKIGEGGFGNVYKALSNVDNCVYAIKEIKIKLNKKKFQRSRAAFESALNEIFFLSCTQSSQVVKLYHAWMEFDNSVTSSDFGFQKQKLLTQNLTKENIFNSILKISKRIRIYIQMELCTSNLGDFLPKLSQIDLYSSKKVKERLEIALQICKGIKTIHDSGIIHRDIKTSNIFLSTSEYPQVKIGDFGLATFEDNLKYKEKEKSNGCNYHTKNVGTSIYMSPEQKESNYYSKSSDIYSLGLVLYELLCPYTCQMEKIENFANIKSKGEIVVKQFKRNYPNIAEMICNMVNKDMNLRPSIDEVVEMIENEIERILFLSNRKMSMDVEYTKMTINEEENDNEQSTIMECSTLSEGYENNNLLLLLEEKELNVLDDDTFSLNQSDNEIFFIKKSNYIY